MHRKHVLPPGREPFFACERLLFFRHPKPRIRDFRIGTRAFRATSFVISTVVIWYTVLFRQFRTDRPIGSMRVSLSPTISTASKCSAGPTSKRRPKSAPGRSGTSSSSKPASTLACYGLPSSSWRSCRFFSQRRCSSFTFHSDMLARTLSGMSMMSGTRSSSTAHR